MSTTEGPTTEAHPALTEAGVMFLLDHRKVCPVPSMTIREALLAIEADARSLPAEPTAPPVLDVERLARVLLALFPGWYKFWPDTETEGVPYGLNCRYDARTIAAEYAARLAADTDRGASFEVES